jgi:hypothetical protein
MASFMSLSSNSDLYAAWREADANARDAESSVLTASLRALDRAGNPPTLAERARAKTLRERANTLLEQAFKEADAFPRSAAPAILGRNAAGSARKDEHRK